MTGLSMQRNIALSIAAATFATVIGLMASGKLAYVKNDYQLINNNHLIEAQKIIQNHVKAAVKGDAVSMNVLGMMYLRGEIGLLANNTPNIEQAIRYFKQASDKGHSGAQNSVATLYLNGLYGMIDGKPDYQQAKKYFDLAVEQENIEGINGLATLYRSGKLDGETSTPNYTKAIELYQKMIDLGDARGYVNLASMYLNGESFEKDHKKAIEILEEAYKLKNTTAMRVLAQIYGSAELNPAKKQDIAKAVKLYKEAVALEDSEAMVMLAYLYANGLYGKKDDKPDYITAVELYQQAARRNNPVAFTNLGNLFYNGVLQEEGKSSTETAKQYWQRAAQMGDLSAKENLDNLAKMAAKNNTATADVKDATNSSQTK